jgi:DNA-binding IscR family transcriptional regulator
MQLRVGYLIAAAVCEIAIAPKLITSQELAARLNLPSRGLEAYLQALVHAGIIGAERGPRGGYFLKRPISEVTVEDVLLAVARGYSIPATPALANKIAIAVGDSLKRVRLSEVVSQA